MTETIEAPTALKQISHWIGGRRFQESRAAAASSTTRRPDSRPARSTSPPPRRSTRRPGCEGGVPGLARDVARAARRDLLPHPRAGRSAPRGDREAPHRGARQGPLGRARRGDARARGDRVLLRDADAAEERVLGAGVDRDRRLLDPPAARRRRGHHAVQLPGDGADVDVGARDRVRQHVRAQAVGEGSVSVALDGRAAAGGGPARRRLQRRHGRQGRGRRGARRIRTSLRSRSSARRRSRATSTRPATATGSAARRSAARRTT